MQTIHTTIGQMASALQQVTKSVDTKRVTIQFKGGEMFVHTCEGGAHARAKVSCQGEMPDALVPLTGKALMLIINSFNTDAALSISRVERGLRFNFGGAKVTMEVLNDLETEIFTNATTSFYQLTTAKINAKKLNEAFQSVERFADGKNNQYQKRGIHIASEDGTLVCAATDGFRVAEFKSDIETPAIDPIILPHNFAKALKSVLDDSDEVEFTVLGDKENKITRFETSNYRLDCPLIGGVFPDYKRVIGESVGECEVNTKELIYAIDRIAVVSGNYIWLKFSGNTVIIESVDGESSEVLETTGQSMQCKLAFQAKLLSDSLASVSSEKVSLGESHSQVGSSRINLKTVPNHGWKAVVMTANI